MSTDEQIRIRMEGWGVEAVQLTDNDVRKVMVRWTKPRSHSEVALVLQAYQLDELEKAIAWVKESLA